jgi:hypothetical protein
MTRLLQGHAAHDGFKERGFAECFAATLLRELTSTSTSRESLSNARRRFAARAARSIIESGGRCERSRHLAVSCAGTRAPAHQSYQASHDASDDFPPSIAISKGARLRTVSSMTREHLGEFRVARGTVRKAPRDLAEAARQNPAPTPTTACAAPHRGRTASPPQLRQPSRRVPRWSRDCERAHAGSRRASA